MGEMVTGGTRNDDPRRLREMLGRVSGLASDHELSSVLVGLAGFEGDLLFPEVVDYVESELRMDDSIFRMTRERAVLALADVNRDQAQAIVERLLTGFAERFATTVELRIVLGFFVVTPEKRGVVVKDVLPALFTGSDASPPVQH